MPVFAFTVADSAFVARHFPEPLFPFEAPPRGLPPPDPTADRPSPQFDGLDLLGRQFIDPELGACTVIGAGTPVFLQPRTGNLGPDPLLPSGWHPTLRYQTVANRIESSSVTEVARWVVQYPPPTLPCVTPASAGVRVLPPVAPASAGDRVLTHSPPSLPTVRPLPLPTLPHSSSSRSRR